MAWCPFALHKPLSENHTQGSITPRAVILHTAVSGASSLFGFFQSNSDLESHFYVRNDGTIEQYMDTGIRADANKNANDFAVSIETQDDLQIKPWTTAQLDAVVRLVDWLCTTHAIPRRQIPAWNSAGIGWHVMFGAPGPWTPSQKTCPGGPRIEQTKNVIIPRVAARQIEGQDMQADERSWLADIHEALISGFNWQKGHTDDQIYKVLGDVANRAENAATAAGDKADAVAAKLDALAGQIGGQVQAAVATYLTANPPTVELDYAKLAAAVNDDADRRARDNNPNTGPTS